jgi:2-succinyl-6-hydroxy-2,4-cyclohexadiene-1-carboxylate synthase
VPPVLFLPGFMQRADSWLTVAGAVSERYPSLVLEFETWTFEERLAEIREAAEPGTVLAGYSMGGRLALHAAVREPSRYGALVLVGASAGIDDPAERSTRAHADAELADWISAHAIDEVVERWEGNPVFASQSEGLVELQREGRLDHDPSDLARLLRSAGQGVLEPLWDHVPELRMPVLALAGEQDERYAAAARRIAELAGEGTAALIPGAGHAAHLERPREVSRALAEFLDEHFGDRVVADLDT